MKNVNIKENIVRSLLNEVPTKIVKLSFGTYEVETKIHHLGKSYAECEKDCPNGWEVLTYPVLQEIRNSKHLIVQFNLKETWEFVQQPEKISKDNKSVARFIADSSRVGLFCSRNPSGSNSSLGVRFMRKIENDKITDKEVLDAFIKGQEIQSKKDRVSFKRLIDNYIIRTIKDLNGGSIDLSLLQEELKDEIDKGIYLMKGGKKQNGRRI